MQPTALKVLASLLEKPLEHSSVVVHGFAIDSRKVERGDLFFALSGQRVDGHAFLQQAASRGAVAAVIDEAYQGDHFGLNLIRVPDVLRALQELARKILKKRNCRVVGVTGSLGKTTTKEFVFSLLKTQYRVAASPYSYNSQATLPLTILKAEGNEEILVLEMGMSQEGEIKRLVEIAPVDIAVLTKISLQHSCNFPEGAEGIFREKSQIFSSSKMRFAVFPHELLAPISSLISCDYKTISLTDNKADFFLKAQEQKIELFSKGESPVPMRSSLPLYAHYQNLLAAIAVARFFCISWKTLQGAVPLLTLPAMRFEKIQRKGIVFINDAYNANPEATIAALKGLPRPLQGGKKIAVLGAMRSLGVYSDQGHRQVAQAALDCVDLLLCLGEKSQLMQSIWEKKQREAIFFQTREAMQRYLKALAQPGDVVLVKGDRFYALEEILKNF